jgi:RHS repeat-associated protein
VAATYAYAAFGKLLSATGPAADVSPFGWQTMYRDNVTGLISFPMRDYSTELARWTTPDPSGEGSGLGLYVYCHNDPINGNDPLGLYSTDFHYYVIYYLLRAKSFSAQSADAIAGYSQFVDDYAKTKPTTQYTNTAMMEHFHFRGSSATAGVMAGNQLATTDLQQAIRDYQAGGAGTTARLGARLHTFADTFAHAGFTAWENQTINARPGVSYLGHKGAQTIGYIGHVDAYTIPDNPASSVANALEAAHQIYNMLPNGKAVMMSGIFGPWQERSWDDIRQDLTRVFTGASSSDASRITAMQTLIQERFGERPVYDAEIFRKLNEANFKSSIGTIPGNP